MFREVHKTRQLTSTIILVKFSFYNNQNQMTNHDRKWKYIWNLGFETLYTNSSNLSCLILMKIMHGGKHWIYQFLYKCTDLMKMISSQSFFYQFVKTGKCYVCNYTSILRKQRNLSLQQVGKEKLITKVCSVHIFNRRCFGIQINILNILITIMEVFFLLLWWLYYISLTKALCYIKNFWK